MALRVVKSLGTMPLTTVERIRAGIGKRFEFMKKLLLLLPLAMVLVGCTVEITPTAVIISKSTMNDSKSYYRIRNANGYIEELYLPADFADVGDSVVYSNRMFFAVKPSKK